MSLPEPTGVCPHDGAPASHQNERYPDALCWGCVDRATDAGGRRVSLHNATLLGGFAASHRDDDSACESVTRSNVVHIDGLEFYANEARFGGVVVRPMSSMPPSVAERPES